MWTRTDSSNESTAGDVRTGSDIAHPGTAMPTFRPASSAAHRPTGFIENPVPSLMLLVIPLFDRVIFALLLTLAIGKRRDPQSRKRLLLIAAVSVTAAALVRRPVAALGGRWPISAALVCSWWLSLCRISGHAAGCIRSRFGPARWQCRRSRADSRLRDVAAGELRSLGGRSGRLDASSCRWGELH
jgi:hypothetical protein